MNAHKWMVYNAKFAVTCVCKTHAGVSSRINDPPNIFLFFWEDNKIIICPTERVRE